MARLPSASTSLKSAFQAHCHVPQHLLWPLSRALSGNDEEDRDKDKHRYYRRCYKGFFATWAPKAEPLMWGRVYRGVKRDGSVERVVERMAGMAVVGEQETEGWFGEILDGS